MADTPNQSKSNRLSVTPEYLEQLWVEQNGRCYLSGEELVLGVHHTEHTSRFHNASVDRIDPTIGYVEGNVAWCHREINYMKGTLKTKDFIELCKSISKYKSMQTSELPSSKPSS